MVKYENSNSDIFHNVSAHSLERKRHGKKVRSVCADYGYDVGDNTQVRGKTSTKYHRNNVYYFTKHKRLRRLTHETRLYKYKDDYKKHTFARRETNTLDP